MVRHNNQLPNNLPQLQNLIKRDPVSYKDEFMLQLRHYKSLLQVFWLNPNQVNKSLDELVMFIAQVAHCYPDVLSDYAQELINLLNTHNTVLDPAMRMTFCRALILLRNKNLLQPTDLLSLFFQLLRCNDKALRTFLQSHIVTDIKNMNAKHKNAKLNTTLQNFMFSMLKDNNPKAAKLSLDIMVELYKKNIWNDVKTVNVIATACFSKVTKVLVTALKFFLSSDERKEDDSDSDSDDEPNAKEVMMANKVNKKTRKREKQLKKVKQLVQKSKKKKSAAPVYNFSALQLIHDPQGMAEKLFKQLETSHERFEVRLMTLDAVSRLIGLHQLILLNFYPYIQRFLQPHQKEVTKLLVYAAQACHDLVPPDVLEPVLRTLVNNFVSERNSSDVMAIGLNAVREMCSRNPLVMTEDLLGDLAQYKNYRERSVMMAARSLIHLYRHTAPTLLHKRDRGKPTEASVELKLKNFGEMDVPEAVPGAEVLLDKNESTSKTDEADSDSEDGSWIDVSHSEDEQESEGEGEGDNDEEENEEEEGEDEDEDGDGSSEEEEKDKSDKKVKKGKSEKVEKVDAKEVVAMKKKQAAEASVMRILTDDDFKEIDAALIRKQIEAPKKGIKRKLEEDDSKAKKELVSLADIENIYKKRKHDKQARIDCVKKGQEGREKFGYKDGRLNPFSSKTNREKKKNKNFMMIKHKVRGKTKRSFKDKQIALRNYLIKQKKMR
ncbi:protein SDA1 homolog [Macrosteles quadrilineatus]|uniref:protein SDA1 homolog n=1 Tax=Macrosteles quadrilineatus TaxID=74068 RepID=UPI0023E32433|nr:protein SDA1 homolog [Macrosteles quadrilineatus]